MIVTCIYIGECLYVDILRKYDVIKRALYPLEVWYHTNVSGRHENKKNIVRVILMNLQNFGRKK